MLEAGLHLSRGGRSFLSKDDDVTFEIIEPNEVGFARMALGVSRISSVGLGRRNELAEPGGGSAAPS